MRSLTTILIVLSACCVQAQAQEPELGGYLEHQIFPHALGGLFVVTDYTKTRLDFGLPLRSWLDINGDIVAQVQHGKKVFNSFDYIPDSVVSAYASALGESVSQLEPQFNFELENEMVVDNAHISLYAGPVQARVGRQQLSWGSGYAWNPSDVFHDKNLTDPTYEKRGYDAAKIEFPLGGMGLISGVLELGERWNRSTKALRVEQHVSGFDVAVSAIETFEPKTDYATFESQLSRRRMITGDFSGALGEVGVWFEGAYSEPDTGKSFSQLLFGTDYTTESGLYLMAEYYYNGTGSEGRRDYDFTRWMNYISKAGESLGRNYLFTGQSVPLSDLLTGSNYVIVNLTDGSAVIYPYFEYSLGDNTTLTMIGYATLGRSDSEFGSFGSGMILRARMYF